MTARGPVAKTASLACNAPYCVPDLCSRRRRRSAMPRICRWLLPLADRELYLNQLGNANGESLHMRHDCSVTLSTGYRLSASLLDGSGIFLPARSVKKYLSTNRPSRALSGPSQLRQVNCRSPITGAAATFTTWYDTSQFGRDAGRLSNISRNVVAEPSPANTRRANPEV